MWWPTKVKCPECGRIQEIEIDYQEDLPVPLVYKCICGFKGYEQDWIKIKKGGKNEKT